MNMTKAVITAFNGYSQFENIEVQETLALLLAQLDEELSEAGYQESSEMLGYVENLTIAFDLITEQSLIDEEAEEDVLDEVVVGNVDEEVEEDDEVKEVLEPEVEEVESEEEEEIEVEEVLPEEGGEEEEDSEFAVEEEEVAEEVKELKKRLEELVEKVQDVPTVEPKRGIRLL